MSQQTDAAPATNAVDPLPEANEAHPDPATTASTAQKANVS